MKIRRAEFIKFYDERLDHDGRGSDVSAITALLGEDLIFGLFEHYWANVENGKSRIISYSCTTGKRKGPRLDGWLLCEKGEKSFLYQAEVKNWAVYSFDEKPLSFDASEKEIEEFSNGQWNYYFGKDEIPHERVAKVLETMKKPDRYSHYESIPLCCFWFHISKNTRIPFSAREYANGKVVHVFSASAYLRSLKDEFVEISMRRFERRLHLLDQLVEIKRDSTVSQQEPQSPSLLKNCCS